MSLLIQDELAWTSCCVCGVSIGMPASLLAKRREDRKSFWCANGHSQSFTESVADHLRKQLARAEQERDSARISRDAHAARADRIERALKRAKRAAGK